MTVDAQGGEAESESVRVAVPASAVTGSPVEINIGENVGETSSAYATSLLGQPVSVEHDQLLAAPLTVSWTVGDISADQAASAAIVRWNEGAQAWVPSAEPVTFAEGVLSARIQEFSVVDILFGGQASQSLGELFGKRASAPDCSGSALPGWVRSTVDPDDGQPAAAILVCFEPDDRDEIVTVRVANNRSFSQVMTLTAGEKFAWTWSGEPTYDAGAAVWASAGSVMNNGNTLLIPPGKHIAVGVARPADGAQSYYSAESTVDWRTVTADLLAAGVNSLRIGGTDNPALNAMLQVMYECMGGRVALSGSHFDISNTVSVVVGCAQEINTPSSEFGAAFEKTSRDLIAKGGLSERAAIQANRATQTLLRWAAVLNAAEAVFYLSDQIANASVGPLSWGVYGAGSPQQLGVWSATCSNVMADSTRLYQNIALQDQFSDSSVELHDFSEWGKAGAEAILPLSQCPPEYRDRFARTFPPTWGDVEAAQILADLILKPAPVPGRWLISSNGVGPFVLGTQLTDIENLVTQNVVCRRDGWGIAVSAAERVDGVVVLGEPAEDAPVTRDGITLGTMQAELDGIGATSRPWEMNQPSSIYTWYEDNVMLSALVDSGVVVMMGVATDTYYLDYC